MAGPRIVQLLEMIRFSHTLFALPFALLAALMAWTANAHSQPPVAWRWRELVGIVLCMIMARSAAMAFNRLADRRIDALNPRTRLRHLPAGVLTVRNVAVFALLAALVFVGSTALFLPNRWPLVLSLPVLLFLLGYSYTKRFTALAHFWLGGALMLAPVASWIAIRGALEWPPLILGSAVLLWVAGFDIIYACQDFEFDVRLGLHSVPARLGIPAALRVAAICHLGMIVMLALLPSFYPGFGAIYWLGIAGAALLLVYEHRLVRPDDLARVNLAFFHVNWMVSLGLLVIGAADLLT